MFSDRGTCLILQAAIEGLVDYSKAKPRDRSWWLRLQWLIVGLEVKNIEKIQTLQYARYLALLPCITEEKAFKEYWERSSNTLIRLYNSLFPWNEQAETEQQIQNDYENLANEWKKRFGDPKDPEVIQKIKNTCELLKASKNAR